MPKSTARRYLTQAQLVAAVRPTVDPSTNKIGKYNRKQVDAFEARDGTRHPAVVLEHDAAAD